MAERTVNARQLEVLRWITDGCPEGVMTGTTYKTTAVALQGRRLATVAKKGGRWRAEATEAGCYFVEHGSYPPEHWSLAPTSPSTTPAPHRPQAARPTRQRKVAGVRPVDQLLADVAAAGGRLEVESDGSYYENLVSSAIRHSKVPDGKLLQVTRGPKWSNAPSSWSISRPG